MTLKSTAIFDYRVIAITFSIFINMIRLIDLLILEKVTDDLIEVQPNMYLYHTSNPMFREQIAKQGLIPKGKSEAWLSDTKISGEVIFAVNSDNKKDWWDSIYDDDIYRIDTTNLTNKWYNDPNFDVNDKRLITFEPIPKSALQLIYKGTGESRD